jgi:hypothetical protein
MTNVLVVKDEPPFPPYLCGRFLNKDYALRYIKRERQWPDNASVGAYQILTPETARDFLDARSGAMSSTLIDTLQDFIRRGGAE